MTLAAGSRLGRYEIRSKIGEGGMGEVYRARDEKLNREVAIKVLPAQYSQDQMRLHRFEQEAQAAGGLNHPNILAIYDVGTHDGAPYVVSELLEGEVLRDRLRDGALPARKAVDYALQVARGLAAAHERKIVHRDIKPENVFITTDERVKILDFGLARLLELIGADEVDMEAPTSLKTAPGVILGTVGYMSPEQVNGRPADHRADLFSFGAVLYEMLTGRRPFQGESNLDTLNAICKEEPPELSQFNPNVPPGLERVVQRCLEKKPEQRFQSASDLAFALEAFSQRAISSSSAVTLPAPARRMTNREWLAWALAGALLLVAATLALLYFWRAPAPGQVARFLVSPPDSASFTYAEESNTLSLSPDGHWLAFTATSEGRTLLYVRPISALEAQSLAGTDGAAFPFWSADSRFVAFLAEGKLKRVGVTGGGPPQIICDVKERAITGTWNREGLILFSVFGGDYGIYRVAASGGAATRVVEDTSGLKDDRRRGAPSWPQFLPDGRRFLYRAWFRDGQPHIFVRSLDSEEDRVVVSAGSLAIYSPPGYLLYVQQGTLLAHPFDAASAQVKGEPIPIVERVKYLGPTGNAAFWVSENGVLAYQSRAQVSRLVWFDRNGEEKEQVGTPGEYGALRLSPDAQRVVVSMADPRASAGVHDLWIYELARATPTRFTTDIEDNDDEEWWPIWSPDGRRIVFATDVGGPPHLFQKGLSDTGGGEQLLPLSGIQVPNDWSADGRFILYEESGASNRMDLWVLPLFGERKPVPFLQTQFNETQAQFSPDGRWVAYVSDESGQPEVYVQAFAGSPERRRISNTGGMRPRWRRDGRELFYLSPDNKMMIVAVAVGTSFEAGEPKTLFRINSGVWQDYDVVPDGQRFLSNNAAASANSLPITVVLNWNADLKR